MLIRILTVFSLLFFPICRTLRPTVVQDGQEESTSTIDWFFSCICCHESLFTFFFVFLLFIYIMIVHNLSFLDVTIGASL
jgi:hypothetical protein